MAVAEKWSQGSEEKSGCESLEPTSAPQLTRALGRCSMIADISPRSPDLGKTARSKPFRHQISLLL